MQYLILVRHGDYGPDGRLTTSGREQMFRLSRLLKERIDSQSVLLFSSTAPRATDSVAWLAEALGVGFETMPLWLADDEHAFDFSRALAFIREHKSRADALIVVTHLPYVEQFPVYFGREELDVALPFMPVDKGDALVIDCEAGTVEIIGRTPRSK